MCSVVIVQPQVPHACVTNVPTLIGGQGTEILREFYHEHFIHQMPADTQITPVHRTVGKTSLVEEMVLSFTHTTQVW